MTPVVQLYWVRVVLGIVAGLVTGFIAAYFGGVKGLTDSTTLINSITIALLIYFVTYYILRAAYKDKIEKPSKILSTAIGMYFFAWITFFVLFYTAFVIVLGFV
jgi:hypothetical protein